MCGDQAIPCGCTTTCTCSTPYPCPIEPCTEGCLTDTRTDCVTLSADLDICSEILPKGSTVSEALAKLGEAVCDGITVTVQDMKVKVDANDTTSGYLYDKITVCEGLSKTVTNVNGNETLLLCPIIDQVTAGNILTSGPNGLYVPTPNPLGYNLSPLFSTTVGLTIASVLGGQSIKADAKISPNAGNVLVDNGGLYVPAPSVPAGVTVSRLNTNSINTTVTLTGTNYQISSNLRLDPSSTAPVSITANGLKVDCCAPVIPANTPITIVPTDSILVTTSGIDSHTLEVEAVISPSAGNALVSTVNGLYCPAPGAAAPTTIIDTPTVDATLISPTTYTLDVIPSADSCNALVLGSDLALYVNGTEEPNSLGFYNDGSDIFFEFQGPSTTDTDYEVEIQGTTGSPTTWIPGAFDSLNGPSLIYYVAPVGVITDTIRARVRTICGTNYSNWVGLTYVIPHTYVSDNSSITIGASTSGIPEQYSFDINCADCDVPTGMTFPYTAVGRNHIEITLGTVPAGVIAYAYTFTVDGVDSGAGTIPAIAGDHKVFSPIEIVTGSAVFYKIAAICQGGCISAFTVNVGTSSVIINPEGCDTDWINLPALSGGWVTGGYLGDPLVYYRDAGLAQYRVNGEYIEFRGTITKSSASITYGDAGNTSSVLQNVAIEDIIDMTALVSCFGGSPGDSYYGLKDTYTALHGVYSYNGASPASRHIDTVHLHLSSVSGTLKAIWDMKAEMFDPNENATIIFASAPLKTFSISLEDVKIKLVA